MFKTKGLLAVLCFFTYFMMGYSSPSAAGSDAECEQCKKGHNCCNGWTCSPHCTNECDWYTPGGG